MVGAAGKAASWPEGQTGTEREAACGVGGRNVGIAGVGSIGVEGVGGVADIIGCAGVESSGSWWVG